MLYNLFNTIFVCVFFILNNFYRFFHLILPAEFLAGNFFIVNLCDH